MSVVLRLELYVLRDSPGMSPPEQIQSWPLLLPWPVCYSSLGTSPSLYNHSPLIVGMSVSSTFPRFVHAARKTLVPIHLQAGSSEVRLLGERKGDFKF